MDKLFLSVLNMSLTGAFVIAAICLARLPLKKAPKIISYALWAVAGFRLVFPFTIESIFSLIPFKAQTIPPDIAMQPIPRIDSGIPFVNNAVSSVLPAAAPIDSVNPLQVWTFIGSWIWIVGVAVMLIYGVVSFVILKRKMRSTAHVEANVYEADNIQSPFVLGVFVPKIYLPVGLSEHERGYILLHEQTHIRRCDHIVKFAAYFVLCLHWFNPLAWAAFLLMGVDMEMSCDERVLKEMGGKTKKDYSLSLLSLAAERRIIGGSPLAFGEGGMKERVKRVLNFKKPSRVIIVAAVALVAVLSVGFACSRASNSNNTDMELIEQGSSFLIKWGDVIYDSTNDLGADGVTASNLRGKQIGYARLDGQNYRWRIYECNGYSPNEYIVVRPDEIMSNYMVYKAEGNDLYMLYSMRTPYVGNNSEVGKIIYSLPQLDTVHTQRFFSVGDDYGTSHAPYTLTIYYEPNDAETDDIRDITVTPKNSALLFALIDNLEEVNYAFRSTPGNGELDKAAYTSRVTYYKNDITEYLGTIGLAWENFQNDWSGSVDRMFVEKNIGTVQNNRPNNSTMPNSSLLSSWKPLHELPVNYSTEQAVADSIYVNIHGLRIYNQMMVDQFYADVYSGGGSAFLRVMQYTIEGDAILTDYQYDGATFTITHDNTRDKFGTQEITTYAYKYLVADDRSLPAGEPMSYYLSNERNIYQGTGNVLIEGIWKLPPPSAQSERAPQLEVDLRMNGNRVSEKPIEAAQLTTSWSYIDENGNDTGYEADSPHALQLNNYDDITLRLNGNGGEISFYFGGGYMPQSVSVQRWNTVHYTGRQNIESSINQNEPVAVSGNTFRVNNDGNDYIYEVYAVFEQGSSYYAFRINAGN